MVHQDDLITTDPERAVEVWRGGGLVCFPTETVYGLAADADNESAVARIFDVKGRPADHPLIVHLGPQALHDGSLDDWIAPDFNRHQFDRLVTAAWPGPLTVIVPRGARAHSTVTGGRLTVGLRIPGHRLAGDLLDRLGGAVAAPSANRFGRVSPTAPAHVVADIGDRLQTGRDVIFDGGPTTVGVESTIVDISSGEPQILRHGAVTGEDIERILSRQLAPVSGAARASGMLQAHYAPSCEVVLADDSAAAEAHLERRRAGGQTVEILDRRDDLVIAARELYSDLRRADERGLDAVVVVLPTAEGLGWAIRDRLSKAANGSARPSQAY